MGEAKRNADRVVGDAGNRFGRAVMLEAMGRIMKRTPVDRGTARANWNLSEGAPDTSTNPAATLADVPAKRASNAAEIASLRLFHGDVGYIANGLPYIEVLENGSSTQAPQGMVAVTVAELRVWAGRMAGRYKRG